MLQILTLLVLLLSDGRLAFGQESEAFIYEMVKLPPGKYSLSIPVATSYSLSYIEKKVDIEKSFYIGKYEVSNAQWNTCFEAGGCRHPAKIEINEGLEHPVVRVTWHDAYEFSLWASKVTGENYRLPSEEEWSYAVHMGQSVKNIEVNYDYAGIKKILKKTERLGFFPTNAWGVTDYLGNVWEWTITCWFASAENILKPTDPNVLNNPKTCFTRIALGENRSHIPDFIADTYSGGCATLRPAANLGFRLIKELK